MNENRERHSLSRLRQEQVDVLPRRIAIAEAELSAPGFESVGAVILRLARPTRKNLGMLGHPGAIVVFGFVVDNGQRRLPRIYTREIAACLTRWQVAAPL